MATSNSLYLRNVSGQIGKELIFKQYGTKTVVSKYPDMSNRELTTKQKQMNGVFFDAIYAAKTVLADEELRNAAQVRLNVTRNKLYSALIKEYIKNARATEQG